MADRFWVGGSGDWTDTAHWSTTSGGAGGAAVPTASDNAIFDVLSNALAYTMNWPAGAFVCNDLTIGNPLAGVITLTGSGSRSMAMGGNFSIPAGVVWTSTISIAMIATSGTKTLTSNGGTFGGSMSFSGAGGTFQLADNFKLDGGLTLTAGTFDPNGKDVTLSPAQPASITGGFTFYNLINNYTVQATRDITLSADITVTNRLTITTTDASRRRRFVSSVMGTPRTITAAAVTLSDTDFTDIVGAGAAAPFTGTRLGNAEGNSGITFATPANKYWVGNTASYTGAVWALTSGGAGAVANFPLPHDTIIFDGNSFSANGQTATVNSFWLHGVIDFSAITKTVTWALGAVTGRVNGNVTLSANLTITGTGAFSFAKRGTQLITSSGVTWTIPLTADSFGGTVSLADALLTQGALTVTSGGFDGNGKNVTALTFSSSNSNTRTITMGAGTWTITGNATTVWTTSTGTGLTLNVGNPIICNYSGSTGTRTISAVTSGTEAQALPFSITAGTDIVSFGAGRAIGSINTTGFSGNLTGSGSLSLYGNVTLGAGTIVSGSGGEDWAMKATSGTKVITTNGVVLPIQIDFSGVGGTWQLADNMTRDAVKQTVLTAGTLDLNGKTLAGGRFTSNNANVRTLKFNGGTIDCTTVAVTTAWDMTTGTNATLDLTGGGTVKVSGSTANVRTFAGGGLTYPTLNFTNATSGGELDITGANTFTAITGGFSTPQSIKFTAGTTTTTDSLPSGTAGNLLSIGSITGAQHTLLKSGAGTLRLDYLNVSNSAASPADTWYAGEHSTNGGNNSGWIFEVAEAYLTISDAAVTGVALEDGAVSLATVSDAVVTSAAAMDA